ncbi:hypothetical protein [Paenibacillus phocaensis]|uniref:hypothetical protein n=1 Tax=Paenibacillus phocaensis TaxID=1776378 RepID=UPI000839CC94|nr:hypothetical protein [Paenibacillus phocaensis]
MFDTMYIFYQLTKTEYNDLFERLNTLSYSLSGSKLFPAPGDKNAYITFCLSKYGLEEIRLRYNREKNYRAIEILLRPKLLVDEGNYFDLIQGYEFEKARQSFKKIMGIFEYLPDLLHWKVKRIDPAVDLQVEEELILTYLFLFKKSNIPSYMLNDKRTQLFMGSRHNFYIASKNVTVNFYFRYIVLGKKIQEGLIPKVNIEPVRNTLRLEIQYRNCSGELYHFLNPSFSQKTILTFFDNIVGSGDYLAFTDAIDHVRKNEKSNLMRIKLTRIIKSINEVGSIYRAKSLFIMNSQDTLKASKEFSSLIQRLRAMDINPVTLPDNHKFKKLRGLRKMIELEFTQKKQQTAL